MPIFVVETIQTYRKKYIIEAKELEHALDTVSCADAEEFSQMYLGEQIITGREITADNFKCMVQDLKEGNGDGRAYQREEGSWWMGEELIHKVSYD